MSTKAFNSSNSFTVLNPGMLCTVQDSGRFQQAHLGITNGGPADKYAYKLANKLLANKDNVATLELSFGGLVLQANCHTSIAVTGADIPFSINGQVKDNWQSHKVASGDKIEFGYASEGCRVYLAVAGGFMVNPQFGSVSTVVREKIGGLNGETLKAGQELAVSKTDARPLFRLCETLIPTYKDEITLRVVTGYQASEFSRVQLNKFFSSVYEVSQQSDRMGYRLIGPSIKSDISQMYSEGISQGAIQVPPDGQPIVLGNDRQTIGGYPKIGSVLSLDLDRLMQCTAGNKVNFEPISIHLAHNLLLLAKQQIDQAKLIQVPS